MMREDWLKQIFLYTDEKGYVDESYARWSEDWPIFCDWLRDQDLESQAQCIEWLATNNKTPVICSTCLCWWRGKSNYWSRATIPEKYFYRIGVYSLFSVEETDMTIDIESPIEAITMLMDMWEGE